MTFNSQLLIVDDDQELLKVYKKIFKLNGFNVTVTDNSIYALELLKTENFGVVISDIIMPKLNGMELLNKIVDLNPTIQVIMLTAEGQIKDAVNSVKTGAFTYLIKPTEIDDLILNVEKAFELYSIKNENNFLKQQMLSNNGMSTLVGQNHVIEDIRSKIKTMAETDGTVLITGESGTGKEIIANQIHFHSKRNNKPFIKVNCAALTESILESELFGHEQGSFTGAVKMHKGKFEAANTGTLLLDEIGELSLSTQVALLRVLQEKEFERVGGSTLIKSDFRLIASTNKNLKEEVANGNFREDLFYRINVLPIYMPPLRERKDDICLLANNWLSHISKNLDKPIEPLSNNLIKLFLNYDWPGNVRELHNIVERLAIMCKGNRISLEDLPEEFKENSWTIPENQLNYTTLSEARKAFEKKFLIKALESNNYNVLKTADEIKLARTNLYKKMKEYNINI